VNAVSAESVRELRRTIEQRGLPFLSANAFSRMVLNAPAGTCSKNLCLRGPLSTVSIGAGSGLMAIVYAAMMMAERDDIALKLAGGVDEIEQPSDQSRPGPREGAACVALATASQAARGVRLAGWGLAGPGDADTAIARAAEKGHATLASVDAIFGVEPSRDSEALGDAAAGALDVARATLMLRAGEKERCLVVTANGDSASCALLLDARTA
jgi:hypothetical protein